MLGLLPRPCAMVLDEGMWWFTASVQTDARPVENAIAQGKCLWSTVLRTASSRYRIAAKVLRNLVGGFGLDWPAFARERIDVSLFMAHYMILARP